MPHVFTLSGQDAIDFINNLAQQDAIDFVKALADAAKTTSGEKSNPRPTDLELVLDENAALREALTSSAQTMKELREALVSSIADNQSAMRAALKELARLEQLAADRLDIIERKRKRLAELASQRYHLNVQLDEAKARVLQVESLLNQRDERLAAIRDVLDR